MKKAKFPSIILYLLIMSLLLGWVMGVFGGQDKIPYSDMITLFENEQVKSFEVKGEQIALELYTPYKGDTEVTVTLADPDVFRLEMGELLRSQKEAGILTSYHFLPGRTPTPYDYIIPIILAGLVLLLLWMFFMSRANSKNAT